MAGTLTGASFATAPMSWPEQQGLTAGIDTGAQAQEESAVGHTEAPASAGGGLEEEI